MRLISVANPSVEDVVVVGLLLAFLTHFYIPILEPVQSSLFAASSDDQTAIGTCISLAIWAIAGTLMLRRYRLFLTKVQDLFWVISLPAFAFLSAIWSQDASITLRKSTFLLLTTAFGVCFARRFAVERQLQLICTAACIAAVLSIIFALLLPAYGLDHDVHQGVWLGIFTQKNVCAREMLFLLASVLSFQPVTTVWRLGRIITVVAVVAVILGTQSKTALLIMAVVFCIFPAIRLLRRLDRGLLLMISLGVFALGATGAALAASALPQFVALLGRDGTMSGRTDIWRAVLEAIFKHPWLGYGFAAFWLSLRGESANIILALRWAVPAAHNGFLDIWLQTGAVGLSLFFAGLLLAGRSAVKRLRAALYADAAWPFAILLLTFIYNLDESSLMQPNDFLWVVYVATLVNLSRPATPAAYAEQPNSDVDTQLIAA